MDIERSPYKSFNSPRIKEPLTGSNFCDGQVRVVVRPIYSACVSIERDHRLRFPNIFFGHCPTPTCFCLVKYLLLLLPFPPLSSSLILSAVSTSTNTTFARSVFVLPPKIPSFERCHRLVLYNQMRPLTEDYCLLLRAPRVNEHAWLLDFVPRLVKKRQPRFVDETRATT